MVKYGRTWKDGTYVEMFLWGDTFLENELKVAVIGAGYWGKNLVRNFNELKVLESICDISPAVCKTMEMDYSHIQVFEDAGDILMQDQISAVVIATSAASHYRFAVKALQAGKHVFVEKPMALTFEEGKHLVEMAKETGKILFVGHILNYHAGIIRLKALINEGAIGRLQYIYSRRLSLGKIRREENILWSFAPHDISVILSLAGEKPHFVDTVANNFLHPTVCDVTMTNLKFPSGIGAHIFVSWLNPFKEQRLVVVGDRGMFVFDDTLPLEHKLVLYNHQISWKDGVPVASKAKGKAIDFSDSWEEPLRAECRAFLDCVENGSNPLTSGEEGLRVLEILERSQRSLEEKELSRVRRPLKSGDAEADFSCHASAVVDEKVVIGKGTKIWHFSHIISGSRIGTNCNIGQNVVIGPDVSIGNGCKIQNNVSVFKGVTLEDSVFCGPSMAFTNVYNPRAEIRRMDDLLPTMVKHGASLGANCTIVCGVTIGQYAFIGAGSVVLAGVPDYALVVGNPARQIGWVCQCGEKLNERLECIQCGKLYIEKHERNEKQIVLKEISR